MWTTKYIISQVFAVLAMATLGITFFVKNKKLIVGLNCLNSLFFATQYLLLGAYTGAVVNVIAIIRGIWIYYDGKRGIKNSLYTLIAMHILCIAASYLTFQVWWDWLALAAAIIYNFILWQSNYKVYRWCGLVASLCWVTYDSLSKAYVGLALECVLVVTEIIGIINLYVGKRKIKAHQN